VNGRVPTEDVEGLVESVNATGLKIGGAGSCPTLGRMCG
jgi:hypothetical protein